jgi:hypothetical protein
MIRQELKLLWRRGACSNRAALPPCTRSPTLSTLAASARHAVAGGMLSPSATRWRGRSSVRLLASSAVRNHRNAVRLVSEHAVHGHR